jgi:phosphatidylethanolamine/phosphatidyl-N-methylethanolamine N-methyltransferase
MPHPALQLLERKFEKQKQLFERKKDVLEREIGRHIQSLERRKGEFERKIEQQFENHRKRFEQRIEFQKKRLEGQIRRFEQKNGVVTPSGRTLARTMAAYIDPARPGPIVELGPGTGPVTEALLAQGVDQSRLILVEFDPTFCRLLRARYPSATIVQGDAYSLKKLLSGLLQHPAAGVVSGLPLFTKPLRMRMRLLFEAFGLMSPGSPFVQFTYNAVPPIPKRLDRVTAEASERIWLNIPPARVWVYRRD